MPDMRNRRAYFATAASLFLGACGSNVEESAGPPTSAVEESAGAATSAAQESAGAPILAAELADRIQAGSPPLVLDVRSPKEYAHLHIRGAINIPHDELATRLAELPIAKSGEVVVHSVRGQRALLAEETLRGSGYSNIRQLADRPKGWKVAGLPTE